MERRTRDVRELEKRVSRVSVEALEREVELLKVQVQRQEALRT